MRQAQLLLLVGAAASCVAAADKPPRGVGPEFVSFYKPSTGTFQCISNPQVQLDYAQVNDDFCDCPDGSDEPGTSACAHLSSFSPQDPSTHFSSKPALPGFYCENVGHQPSYLPFTRVNDGACDHELCCDGSEEFDQVGQTKCEDKCKEIGDEWKRQDEARQKSLDAAVGKRKDLIRQAKTKRKEMTKQIEALKTQITTAEVKIHDLTQELDTLVASEKRKSQGPPSKVQELVDWVQPRMQNVRDALIKVKAQRDGHADRVSQLELILDDLHKSYNPNFNDEGVKRVIKSYEAYKAVGKDEAESDDTNLEDRLFMIELEEDDSVDYDRFLNPPKDDAAKGGISAIYEIQQYLPASALDWISSKIAELRNVLVANGILAHSQSSGDATESKVVRDARSQLDTAKTDLENLKKKKTDTEEDLTKDYGLKDVFRPLKGNCLSLDAGEYTYEMCWLDKVSQKSKKGGMGHQDMGHFTSYQTIHVDEEMPADGKGLGTGWRLSLQFTNGNNCWNGPNRSTTVVLACAETEEIWKVTEEEKCVYRMLVGSPVVCDEPGSERDSAAKVEGGKAPAAIDHDEL